MLQTTLLAHDQIWGFHALDIMKTCGTKTGVSDFAIALGAHIAYDSRDIFGLPCGFIHTQSVADDASEYVVSEHGTEVYSKRLSCRDFSIRPVLDENNTRLVEATDFETVKLSNDKSVKIAYFGEYPQTHASEDVYKEWNKAKENNALNITGKIYTLDETTEEEYKNAFYPGQYAEYELNGEKYVPFTVQHCDFLATFSDKTNVIIGKEYLFKVEPIEWLVDESGVWVAKKALLSGIPYGFANLYDGDFEKTIMSDYLNICLSREILPLNEYLNVSNQKEVRLEMNNFENACMIKPGHREEKFMAMFGALLKASQEDVDETFRKLLPIMQKYKIDISNLMNGMIRQKE